MNISEVEELAIDMLDRGVDGVQTGQEASKHDMNSSAGFLYSKPGSGSADVMAVGHCLAHGGLQVNLAGNVFTTKGVSEGVLNTTDIVEQNQACPVPCKTQNILQNTKKGIICLPSNYQTINHLK